MPPPANSVKPVISVSFRVPLESKWAIVPSPSDANTSPFASGTPFAAAVEVPIAAETTPTSSAAMATRAAERTRLNVACSLLTAATPLWTLSS